MGPDQAIPVSQAFWPLLLALAERGRDPARLPAADAALRLTASQGLAAAGDSTGAQVIWRSRAGWCCGQGLAGDARDFVELYLPICQPVRGPARIAAHLGQSLDGCIATRSGDAQSVTGPENFAHLHRMRALSDAVLVGAGTVASDDPRLTTRLVSGPSPVRVILDPRGRLGAGYRVFTDGAAATLLCRGEGVTGPAPDGVETLPLPRAGKGLDLGALVRALAARGLRRLFIEGGGVTVSAFLAAGLLDRLQVAVAPVIIGGGRCGVDRPPVDRMAQALRPPGRIYQMGADVLYDFDLRQAAEGGRTRAPVGFRRLR